MNPQSTPLPLWNTASFGDAADTLPTDLDALGKHMQQCQRRPGPLYVLWCRAEALHDGLLARFVTSLTLVAAVAGAAATLL
jgi:hypothetical protein